VGRSPRWVHGDRRVLLRCVFVFSWLACQVRRAVRLICSGWLPQDGLFAGNGPLV
jgi:hypothetical protein